VSAQLDLSALRLVKDSFVDDTLQEHFSDLLCEVDLQDRGKAFVYVLFEHKSYVDAMTPLQVLRYMVRVWDYGMRQRGRLLPVIPVVVYHGIGRWTAATHFHGLLDLPEPLRPYVPEFHYHLSDLSTYSDEELKRTAEVGVGLLLLKHIFRPDLREQLPEVLSLWYRVREQENALGYLEAILRYVVSAGPGIDVADVRKALEEAVPEGDVLMGTIAEEWIKQGKEQGLQQGLQQGLRQGLQEGLQEGLRQGLLDGIELALDLRFGLTGLRLLPEIIKIEEVGVLKAIHEGIRRVERPEELRQFYQNTD
jgi:predicted transposase/invertase (TIGR01784 family)